MNMAGRPKKVAVSKSVSESVEAVKSVDLKTELDAIAAAQLEVTRQLSSVGAVVNERIGRVADLDVVIEVKEKRVEELNGLEAALLERNAIQDEIVALEEAHLEKKIRLEKEYRQKQEDLESDHKRRVKNYDAELADKKALFDKEQAVKVADLVVREKALASLQAQVDAHPKALEAAEGKGRGMEKDRLTKEFEHQKRIYELEATNTLALVQSKLDNALNQIATLTAQNEKLSSEAVNARKDANEVVAKTVEATSQRTAYENLLSQIKSGEGVTGKR